MLSIYQIATHVCRSQLVYKLMNGRTITSITPFSKSAPPPLAPESISPVRLCQPARLCVCSLDHLVSNESTILERYFILLAQEKNGPVARASAPRDRNIPIILPF